MKTGIIWPRRSSRINLRSSGTCKEAESWVNKKTNKIYAICLRKNTFIANVQLLRKPKNSICAKCLCPMGISQYIIISICDIIKAKKILRGRYIHFEVPSFILFKILQTINQTLWAAPCNWQYSQTNSFISNGITTRNAETKGSNINYRAAAAKCNDDMEILQRSLRTEALSFRQTF